MVYVPDAQGGLPPGPHALYVLGTRTSLGRAVRTAHRGKPAAQVGWLSPQVLSNASYMTSQIKDLADKIEQADGTL